MEENANKLHFISSNIVIHPQLMILSVFNIASFPHTGCILIKVFMILFFLHVNFYNKN